MPLRRCTARTRERIGKVKRPRRAAEAWSLLGAVHRAFDGDPAGFLVPEPVAYDAERARYVQTAVTGDDLSEILDAGLMRRAGELHRAMHAADVPGMPAEDPAQALAEPRADARWVAFAVPGHAEDIRAILTALERHAPGAPAFCHGDLVPSQMLVGERWAITDFDGARLGDPHRDLAIWLAALTSAIPAPARPWAPPGASARPPSRGDRSAERLAGIYDAVLDGGR